MNLMRALDVYGWHSRTRLPVAVPCIDPIISSAVMAAIDIQTILGGSPSAATNS